MNYWKTSLIGLFAVSALAGEPVLTVQPNELRGIPGQPLQVELTVETDSADSIQLKVPAISNLVLRAVEKVPILRTLNGTYVQKRIITWQGVEAGSATVTNLTVVFQTLEKKFPNIGIIIDPVEPAAPPQKQEVPTE